MICQRVLLRGCLRVCDGRRPSSDPTTRSMARKIQEDWDSATDGRDTLLYMFKNAIS